MLSWQTTSDKISKFKRTSKKFLKKQKTTEENTPKQIPCFKNMHKKHTQKPIEKMEQTEKK